MSTGLLEQRVNYSNTDYEYGPDVGGTGNADADNNGRKEIDCSNLLYKMVRGAGYAIPYQSTAQLDSSTYYDEIAEEDVQPGDVALWRTTTHKHTGVVEKITLGTGKGEFFGSQTSTGPASAKFGSGYWPTPDLLADAAGNRISGWLAEQDMITTRHSPWEWEGFDFISETACNTDQLACHFEAQRLLTEEEKPDYQAQISTADHGPIKARLYDIIDGADGSVRDNILSVKEIKAALSKPWHAQSISRLITHYESEWFWQDAKWDELDKLMDHTEEDPNPQWVREKERIKKLSWWEELTGKQGINADGQVWHLQPAALIGNFSSPRAEEITVPFLEKILKKPGSWFTGRGGSRSFTTSFQENYPDIYDFDKNEFVEILNKALIKHGITTGYQKAHFLAQCFHESAHFETTIEFASGEGYNPGRHADAEKNGNTTIGDGPKYKGKGLIQLTWKNNYEKYSEYRGIDFVAAPDLIASNMFNSIDVSCWYWRNNGGVHIKHNAKGDINVLIEHEKNNVDLITLAVNGGSNGLAERKEIFATIKKEWNLT